MNFKEEAGTPNWCNYNAVATTVVPRSDQTTRASRNRCAEIQLHDLIDAGDSMNMVYPLRRWLASLTCAAMVAGAPVAFAADEAKPKAEAGAKAEQSKKEAKKEERRGPIPELYGKIVAPDQKEKIYAIQDKYQAEMAPLVAKIKELQAAQAKEIESVLTPEQLTRLQQLKAEQVKAAQARREQMQKNKAAAEKPTGEKSAEATKPAAEKAEGGK